ncbi:hypothetical protein KSC_062640 [Ktedonobacter sp. SOSP1-52]|uniref:hypothetical protein n=1 Tax=Ktedonobacter sp. SOSP1-52 TaxID=2778366 RepID=UPI001914F99F|nr:hypothetical protein [Ktedonobacter sp. SOSP1-52]GHO67372.1 hypothetical protein KSC_062640 [Ktedonobacter sp. SOSP1-52]
MKTTRDIQHETYSTPTASLDTTQNGRGSGNKAWGTIAVIGACIVISLYLVVPLMIFFSGLHDWMTQLLCALFILTLGEFIICSILIKTSRARKLHTQEMRTLQQQQHKNTIDSTAQNMPFNVLVDAETERFPVAHSQQSASPFEQDETVKIPVTRR